MRKFLTFAVLGFITLLICTTCAGGAKDKRASDSAGNLKIDNQSGVELAVYVNKLYKKTAKTGELLSILVDNAEAAGSIVEVEFFYRNKLTDLASYPTNEDARYISFPKTVRPLGDPDPVIPIYIRALSSEDLSNNAGINSVLVKFSYNDFPRVISSVSVFTGSQAIQTPIVRLDNGQAKFAPMPVGYNSISLEYVIGGRTIQRKVYPETQTQRNDRRFAVYAPSGATETEHVIPLISDIYNVSFVSNNPATRGTLRVKNQSSSQVNIRIGGGTRATEEPINGADSVVLNEWPRRDFLIPAGNYFLRAVNAAAGGVYTEIARIDDISVEPGMIYYWFIQDQSSSIGTGINLSVPQQINNWFQDWTINTSPAGAKIILRITSTTNDVNDTRRDMGVTDRNGQLVRRDIDIGDLIRGLSTNNAKKVTLTLIAEKDGYGSVSQSINAYNLLATGKDFRPDLFSLEKIDESANVELVIGEPKIP
jgi:hypothetical protein